MIREPVDFGHSQPEGVLGPDEGLRFFINNIPVAAGECINLNDAKSLVPSVDLLIADHPAISTPSQAWSSEINDSYLRLCLHTLFEVKPVELMCGEFVSRKRVAAGLKFGSSATLGGGLDHMNLTNVAWLNAKRDKVV